MDRSLRVLLIEDDPDDALLVATALAAVPSVTLAHVTSLSAARAAVARQPPDVALLDLHLPDARGLATVEQAVGALGDVPVVALTSLRDEAVADLALRRGAQDYLLKDDLHAATLLRACTHAIARAQLRQASGAAIEHLRTLADRHRALVAHHPDAVLTLDAAGALVAANVAAQVLFRRDGDSLLGSSLTTLVAAEDQGTVRRWWRDVERGSARSGEVRLDVGVAAELTLVPLEGSDGAREAFAIVQDLTLRRRALADRDLLAGTLGHLVEGVLLLDARTLEHLYANPAAARLLGLPVAQIVGRRLDELFPASSLDSIRQLVAEPLAAAGHLRFAQELHRVDGSSITLDIILQRVALADAEDGLAVLLRDRGDLDRSEREQQQLRALVGTDDLVIVTLDGDGQVVSWNPGAARILGVPRSVALGRPFDEVVPRLDVAPGADGDGVVAGTVVLRRNTADGPRTLSETRLALHDARGEVIGTSIVARDLTREETMRADLQAVMDRFAELAAYTEVVSFVVDATDRRLLEVSASVERVLGYSAEELLADPAAVYGLVHPTDLPTLLSNLAAAPDLLVRFRHRDGGWRSLELVGVPVIEGDTITTIRGYARDVTDRREAELQLEAYASRLEEANEQLTRVAAFREDLLAIVSHELRTPLTPITGFAALLRERHGELLGDDGRRMLEVVARNADRLVALVDELLLASKATAGSLAAAPQAVDLRALVGRLREDLAAEDLLVELPPGEVVVWADPHHLERILTNLLTNARRYGRPPVHLTVEVTPTRAVLQLRDHGEGVPQEFVPRMFQPFTQASTGVSRTGTGVGLGLWIVDLLVRANDGSIAYVPSEGGATFELRLPVPTSAEHATPARPHPLRRSAALAVTRDAVAAALDVNDLRVASEAVEVAVDGGATVRDLIDHVLRPVLADVGDRWARGELSVAGEHRATQQLSQLAGWLATRPPSGALQPRPRVVAAAPGDRHELAARLAAVWLADAGGDVRGLGELDGEHLADALDERPDALLLTVTDPACLDAAAEATSMALARGVPVLLGGAGVTRTAAMAMGAHAASGLDEVLRLLERWVRQGPPRPAVPPWWPPPEQRPSWSREDVERWCRTLPAAAQRLLLPELERVGAIVALAEALRDPELLGRTRRHLASRLVRHGADPRAAETLLAQLRSARHDPTEAGVVAPTEHEPEASGTVAT